MKILICDKLEEEVVDKFSAIGEITDISISVKSTFSFSNTFFDLTQSPHHCVLYMVIFDFLSI